MSDQPICSSERRNFLKAAAGSALILKPETVFGSQANSAVEVGIVGCGGRGNGAEGLQHAFADAIERTGAGILLASVGCFGSCFQEPLVNVRLPGSPLVILHRVQANDVGRILHDISTGNITPDLVFCKIEEWDHITSQIKYGHGYPEVPAWNEVPFFKGQRKTVLRNCGFINPEDMAGRKRVCMIGDVLASDLFGRQDVVGETIAIDKVPFTVVGVMRKKLQSSNYNGQRDENCAFIPWTTFAALYGNKYVSNLIFRPLDLGRAPGRCSGSAVGL